MKRIPTLPSFLFHPRYWLLWPMLGGLWLTTSLPYALQMRLGRILGNVFRWLAPRRRRIAAINLKLCFPAFSDAQRAKLLRAHFTALGMGLMDFGLAWWASERKLASLGQVEGLEHLHAALAEGRGVILLSAHFTTLDLGARYLIMHQIPLHSVYRPNENAFIEYFMQQSRIRYAERTISRHEVREMVRSLRANKPVWFAPDQNYNVKNSVFVDFFGIPAATNTATARLTRITGAKVIPFFIYRLADYQGYRIRLLPALTNFPSSDNHADTQRVNHVIEEAVRLHPEQYFWVHRRFKDRPGDEARFY